MKAHTSASQHESFLHSIFSFASRVFGFGKSEKVADEKIQDAYDSSLINMCEDDEFEPLDSVLEELEAKRELSSRLK